MIYETRAYIFHSGKLSAYLDIARNMGCPVRLRNHAANHGYWVSEFGSLNRVWRLCIYASLDERKRMGKTLSRNERWIKEYVPNGRPVLPRLDIRFFNPPLWREPTDQGRRFFQIPHVPDQSRHGGRLGRSLPGYHADPRKIFTQNRHWGRRCASTE